MHVAREGGRITVDPTLEANEPAGRPGGASPAHGVSSSRATMRKFERKGSSRLSRGVTLVFVFLTAFLIIGAVYTSTLILQRQMALREASRYNATWLVSQAALEVSRLTSALASFGDPGVETDVDDVRLRLDIVASRITTLTEGDQGQFIHSRGDLAETIAELREAVAFSTPIVAVLQPHGSTAAVYAAFVPLSPRMNHLAASVHERGAELVTADLRSLENLSWIFSGLLIGLILCSFGLIAFARWNYGMLAVAHGKVGGLVDDLHVQNDRFDAALNNMSQGLCMGTSDLTLVVGNDRFQELFGLPDAIIPGTAVRDLYQAMALSSAVSPEFALKLMTTHVSLIKDGLSVKVLHEAGERSLTLTHEPMPDGGWVTTFEDITEQRKAEARITFMANHDILTGLPNRLMFRDRLSEAISKLGKSFARLSVICLDLDRFKQINDSLGHPAGDSLLRIVAARLRRAVSENDVVARLGGDEFVVFCTGTDHPLAMAGVAERIIAALGDPYDLSGHRAVISASIGIAETTDPMADADLLLKNADLALYRAKADGRATYRFFEKAMEIELLQRQAIEMDLDSAMENRGLEVYYQPVLGLRARDVVGFEALLRWHHPERGLISPSEFIPIAEDTGLIMKIGAWVLDQACAEAARWPEPKKIAVNLSAIQFEADIVKTVSDALMKSGLAPELLELEITESVLLKDHQTVLLTMRRLRNLGVRIVLDDFGTGYSALSYLRMFPFNKLKIDRAFVIDICEREESRAIVTSIVQLAAALGMTTTAEGVETAAQAVALTAMGCDEGQGFFFGHPSPAGQVHRWFNRNLTLVS
jgi:diguanylate cyclase (GGDEF)-like protein